MMTSYLCILWAKGAHYEQPKSSIPLGVRPQPISKPVVIGEEPRHLCHVVNGDVVETVVAQGLQVFLFHPAGIQGELVGIFQDGPVDRLEIGRQWICLDRRCQLVAPRMILDLGPEILTVLGRSVVAVVPRRNRGGDHLSLGPGEWAVG